MAQPKMQFSFNAGEWAPALNARVDIAKYHNGAALLKNFFVDYRGGATIRPGTKYILQTRFSTAVRLIPFQASLTVSYVLEFGQAYIRFYANGSPVTESTKAITAITKASPGVVTSAGHGYSTGDWVYITGVAGMTEVNNAYYILVVINANTYSLTDLNGVAINTTSYTTYTSGGTSARIYTLGTSYSSTELDELKFAQNVDTMILCHPNHAPAALTLVSAASWTFGTISFGTTISTPSGAVVTTTLAGGTVYYAYIITAVDANGQESAPSAYATLGANTDIRTVAGTNTVTWAAVSGAVSYNVYRANPSYGAAVPSGSTFGFIGNVQGVQLIDSNIGPDFSSGPPVIQSPFTGAGALTTIGLTAAGVYTTVPTVTLTASPGVTGTATASLQITLAAINGVGTGYAVGDTITLSNGVILSVATIGALGVLATISIVNAGSITVGATPANPVAQSSTSGAGTGGTFDLTWGIKRITIGLAGSGYVVAPSVLISGAGGGAAIAYLGAGSAGNPTVPGFFDQRMVLAGPTGSPQQFNMSQPGSYYNFNTSDPIEGDNAISGTLSSGQLNTIQSLVIQPQGLIIFSDRQAWLLNGGSPGSPVSATQIVANSQAYNGAGTPPPIVANDNVLYVQSKGSIVRDLVFNFYTQVYTGTDISVLSSHLFYGYTISEWAWAEEPYKIVWAVRNDGTMLTLTFLKEQELVAWAHSDTNGTFESVASITETVTSGKVDAVYTVVQRIIGGNTVQYVERFAELYYPVGVTDAWQVDAGLQYNGSSVLTFTGAQHLATETVTGLATDNTGEVTVITPFTMASNGSFTLTAPPSPATGYTRVTIGLAFTPQLQTLQLDTGEPTIQGKMKSIPAVTVRVNDTLGLSIGKTFDTLVAMKDLVRGNVGSATNEVVSDLVTGDAMTRLDPSWTVPGQYCIEQPYPYPASILGVIPQIAVGDTQK